jgi:hypothetical protein
MSPLTLTTGSTNQLKQQLESPHLVRPHVTGDGNTALTVRICIRRA